MSWKRGASTFTAPNRDIPLRRYWHRPISRHWHCGHVGMRPEKPNPVASKPRPVFRLPHCHVGMWPCRHHADVGTVLAHGFSYPLGGVHFQLSSHHFPPFRRKVNVKLRPNFTSKRAFLEAKKQAFLMRRMLIIRHKHSQVGWWGVRKNSVKLKKQVLMEFGGWSLPPLPKSLIVNRFPYSTRRVFHSVS